MEFSSQIIQWYDQNKRDLPWRKTKDPYKIWLSEIILQQTRVEQGLPYYFKFVSAYPTIDDLSLANEEEVMVLWQGLGYYSRARNLHFTAKHIVKEHKSIFPANYNEIIKLKGIGDYTASAISSFSFNEQQAVLDGNVIRVLTRYFGNENDISIANTLKNIKTLSKELLPDKHSDTYNQGIMEFGALQCKPKSPNCEICPLLKSCQAYKLKKVDLIPYKSKKVITKHRYFNYLVFKFGQSIYLKQRVEKDIWQNLFDFPLKETANLIEFNSSVLSDEIHKTSPHIKYSISSSEDFKHILSHQKLHVRFFLIELNQDLSQNQLELHKVDISSLDQFAKPILIQNYLNKYIL